MRTIRGPALFLAQFAGDAAPFNDWRSITAWAAACGHVGVQVPSWDTRVFDLDRAAASKDYCGEIKGIAGESGIVITELSTHLQGQLVAVHTAAREGAAFVNAHLIRVSGRAFDDFADAGTDRAANRRMLGLE